MALRLQMSLLGCTTFGAYSQACEQDCMTTKLCQVLRLLGAAWAWTFAPAYIVAWTHDSWCSLAGRMYEQQCMATSTPQMLQQTGGAALFYVLAPAYVTTWANHPGCLLTCLMPVQWHRMPKPAHVLA